MSSYAPLRNDLMTIGGVESVSLATFTPSSGGNNDTDPSDPDHPISYQVFMGDTAFIRTCGFEIVRDNDARTDQGTWLNEEAIRANGLTVDADEFSKNHIPIAGVLRDFRFRDLSQPVGPAKVYVVGDDNYCMNVLVRISTANDPALTFQQVSQTIEKHTDGRPFSCHFTDQLIRDWYENQLRTANAVGYLTLIAYSDRRAGTAGHVDLLYPSTLSGNRHAKGVRLDERRGAAAADRGFHENGRRGIRIGRACHMVYHARVAQRLHRMHRYRLAHVRRRRTDCRRDRASDRLLAELRAANANPVDSVKK